MNRTQYRPEIDGLRAVAVTVVLLFHAGGVLPGGYVGVDVFFVISGFLITSLIRKDLAANTFRLSHFWERRIRRIFPAQAVLVTVVLGCGMLSFLPADLYDLGKSALAQSALLSNVYFWRHLGYFDGPAELKPLLHMWSLAVEEQFYLGFPLLLWASRRMRGTALCALLALLASLSFLLSIWGTHTEPSATFFLLPTRAWELLAGALLTFAPQRTDARRWVCEAAGAAGFLAICAACVLYDDRTPFPGIAALLPCCGAALIIHFNGCRRTCLGDLLAARPMVFVGLISYSLYLWHWPAFAFCRYFTSTSAQLDVGTRILASAGSFGAAYLSWKYVECPFRPAAAASPAGRGPLRVFSAALIVSSVIVALSCTFWRTQGLPQRFSKEIVALAEVQPRRFGNFVDADEVNGQRLPNLGDVSAVAAAPSFLLWGDSHAMAIAEIVDELAKKHGVVGYLAARPATVPLLGTWRPNADGVESVEWKRACVEFIGRNKVRHVILASRWSVNVEGRANGSLDSLIVDGRSRAAVPSEAREVFKRGVQRTIDELRRAGASVWIMKQVPEQTQDPRRALALAALWRKPNPRGVSLDDHRRLQSNVDAVLDACAAADVRVCDPADHCFDASGRSRIGGSGRSYYVDGDHLSSYGTEALLGRTLDQWFTEIARGDRVSSHP